MSLENHINIYKYRSSNGGKDLYGAMIFRTHNGELGGWLNKIGQFTMSGPSIYDVKHLCWFNSYREVVQCLKKHHKIFSLKFLRERTFLIATCESAQS